MWRPEKNRPRGEPPHRAFGNRLGCGWHTREEQISAAEAIMGTIILLVGVLVATPILILLSPSTLAPKLRFGSEGSVDNPPFLLIDWLSQLVEKGAKR
jgi:hypothetical protein